MQKRQKLKQRTVDACKVIGQTFLLTVMILEDINYGNYSSNGKRIKRIDRRRYDGL